MDKENTTAQPPFERITPPSAGTMACKRAFDIVCSFLGLAILSPVLLVVSVLVIWCHRENIVRLVQGRENKFRWHSGPPKE